MLAAWFGLVTGYAEVAYLIKQVYVRHVFVWRGRDALWMTPFAEMAFFLLLGGILGLAGHLSGRSWTLKRFTAVLGAISAFSFLVMYERLHLIAAVLFALGLGALAGRIADRWPELLRRVVLVTMPAMAVLCLLLGVGLHMRTATTERAALDDLPAARPGSPNILLLVLDTVRAAELDLHGYSRPTSPNLNHLSRRGVRFDHAIAPSSWTLPSHSTLFTGRLPQEHGAEINRALPDSFLTLAEFLSHQGYRTGGFVGNIRFVSWEMGLAQGFSHYEDYQISALEWILSSTLLKWMMDARWFHSLIGAHDEYGRRDAGQINAAFLEWVGDSDRRPFFAFLNFYDAHWPYLPDERFAARFDLANPAAAIQPYQDWLTQSGPRPTAEEVSVAKIAYDASIASLDADLGLLLAELDRRGILDNTIIAITSDHGEEFGENGVYDHGNSLYRSVLWVPFVLVAEGLLHEDLTVDAPVELGRLPATIVDLLDLETESPFPGPSLVGGRGRSHELVAGSPVARSELAHNPHAASWAPISRGDMRSLFADSLHYIVNEDGHEELYNIVNDPWEERNLFPAWNDKAVVESLRSRLRTPPPDRITAQR